MSIFRIRLRYKSWIPKILKTNAVVIYPFILFKRNIWRIPNSLYKHEFIHIEQIRREGILKFYFMYLFDFISNLIEFKDYRSAWKNVPYEVEAYWRETEKLSEEESGWIRRSR
jgi:hypothetical protein